MSLLMKYMTCTVWGGSQLMIARHPAFIRHAYALDERVAHEQDSLLL
jgi:hypothetical protein